MIRIVGSLHILLCCKFTTTTITTTTTTTTTTPTTIKITEVCQTLTKILQKLNGSFFISGRILLAAELETN